MGITSLVATTKVFRRFGPSLAVALVAGLVWNPASASCARIKIEIMATVSFVDDPDNLLNNAVEPGDIITGIYTYDSFAVGFQPTYRGSRLPLHHRAQRNPTQSKRPNVWH